jgi:hypothetical protein
VGELLRQYGPAVLAWALFLSRRPSDDRARQCVRWVLLGLAVSLTVLVPTVYAAIGDLSGVKHLARLIGHGAMLFVAWAGMEFLSHVNGLGRGSRWFAWWSASAFVAMCLLFAYEPSLQPWRPGVLEYCVAYFLGQAPALGNMIRLGLRYTRVARDRALRVGLRLLVAGTAGALLYVANKVVLTASRRFDLAYSLGDTVLVSKVLPASAHVLVLVGATLPTLLGWLHRYLLYQRLGPLWRALYRADPTIALDPPVLPDVLAISGLRLRLYRRVIEIRDGLLMLRPYRPELASDGQHEAAVEAAAIVASLRARTGGPPPATPRHVLTGGRDLDSDTAFLGQVARAYRKIAT